MGLSDTRETAAFNLALPYLMRVNSILNSNYTSFRNGDIRTFAINLKQLFRELYPWLKIEPRKNIDEINPLLNSFKELAKTPKSNKELIWEQLELIEMKMRGHFKDLGMLMPKLNDPRFLFGNKQK